MGIGETMRVVLTVLAVWTLISIPISIVVGKVLAFGLGNS